MDKQGLFNDKRGLDLGGIMILFVGIIFALALLPAIFSSQNLMTDKQSISNESNNLQVAGCYTTIDEQVNESTTACNITLDQAPTTWKITECPLSGVSVFNTTVTLVDGTGYNLFASSGIIQMLNVSSGASATGNDTFGNIVSVDYTFCADGYNTSSGARGMARLIGLFAIIALFIWVAARSEILDFDAIRGS